jgi:alpha-tubulin suppressor-like RCC1 family protein
MRNLLTRGATLVAALALVVAGAAPVAASGNRYVQISAGGDHTCAITSRGAAYCWGGNFNGALGDGTETDSGVNGPQPVIGGLRFVSISAGDDHTCGLTRRGAAYCWGDNGDGQLGDGTTNDSDENGPQPVIGGLTFTRIIAADDYTCAITSRGAAYCWGVNSSDGELGDGTTTDSDANGPQPVIGGLKFVSLSAQEDFTCGLTTRGAAYCWGYNGSRGQLGDGTTTTASGVNGPQRVIGGHRFQALQVGSDGACGLTTRGQTYCWGDNSSDGELGDGTTTSSGVNGPQRVIGGIRFASFPVVSGEEHRCALTARGEAYCWGSNDSGQIGDGSGTGAATSELLAMGPRRVIGGLRFTSISVSEDRSCALTSSGAAYCGGDNFDGALGDGTTTDSDANGPQPVK